MVGLGETLGSPWIPLAIWACLPPLTTLRPAGAHIWTGLMASLAMASHRASLLPIRRDQVALLILINPEINSFCVTVVSRHSDSLVILGSATIRQTMLKNNLNNMIIVRAQVIQLLRGLVTKNFEPENSRS
jgi:hypothetical protein